MNKIKLVTDTACDLPISLLKELGIGVVPLMVDIDNKIYIDQFELCPNMFFEILKTTNAMPKTAGVNPNVFEDEFKHWLDQGYDIVYVGLGSNLSCTCQNAVIAKNILDTDRIHIIDTNTTSIAQGMVVLEVAEMIKEGKSIEEILKEEERLVKVKGVFTPGSLEMLKRGGRINSVVAKVGQFFNIKPILVMSNREFSLVDKAKGIKGAIKKMIEYVENNITEHNTFIIAHANNESNALILKEKIKELYPTINIEIYKVGAVIGSHLGDNSLGFAFR